VIPLFLRPLAVITVTVCTLTAVAQEPKTVVVKGNLHDGQAVLLHGYIAELNDVIHPGESVHTDVASDGAFSFRGVPYGDYLLRITDYYGTVLAEQFVTVRESQGPLDVQLSRGKGPRPASERISLRELQHPPAPKAVNAALAGERFAQSGKYERAADELRKAVQISPEFAQAHASLGVQYVRLRQFQQAKDEFDRALEIAGPDPVILSNLAFARTALGDYAAGAAAAREALRIDPNEAHAHYILGTILLLRNETRAEGIAHLERAARTIESARTALARVAATH
jgi:tetratricopeptide (TPR) repeat protein